MKTNNKLSRIISIVYISMIIIVFLSFTPSLIKSISELKIETYLCQDKLGGENLEGIMCEREVYTTFGSETIYLLLLLFYITLSMFITIIFMYYILKIIGLVN